MDRCSLLFFGPVLLVWSAKRWKFLKLSFPPRRGLIAHELGVSQATISTDVKALRKEWKENRIHNTEESFTEEQQLLQQIARAIWVEVEQSRQPLETTRIVQKNGERKAEKTVRQHPLNPRLFKLLLEVSERRCALLGLNADALKSSASQTTVNAIDWDRLYEEAGAAANEDVDRIERQIAEAGKPRPKARRKR